jgi:hypothetical protein
MHESSCVAAQLAASEGRLSALSELGEVQIQLLYSDVCRCEHCIRRGLLVVTWFMNMFAETTRILVKRKQQKRVVYFSMHLQTLDFMRKLVP